jgi:hypothetical protein
MVAKPGGTCRRMTLRMLVTIIFALMGIETAMIGVGPV